MKGKLRLSNISSTSPLFQLQVVHHDGKIEKIDPKTDSPLLSPGFTNSMRNCPTGSPIHVRLIAEIDIGKRTNQIPLGSVTGKQKYSINNRSTYMRDYNYIIIYFNSK